MIRDNDLCMNPVAGQVVTASAPSTDVIDLTKAGDAVQTELYLVIRVAAVVTAAGNATVTFALQTDDNDSFSSATDLWTSAAIPKATLVANHVVVKVKIPVGCEQYLRVYYTVATGPLTVVSAFDAFLVSDVNIT